MKLMGIVTHHKGRHHDSGPASTDRTLSQGSFTFPPRGSKPDTQSTVGFTRQNFSVILADNTDTPQEVLTTTVPIQIAHKTITVEMIVLPNAKSDRTLLGIDFLSKAQVLLNTAEQAWCFVENFEMPFPYAIETRIDSSPVESSTSVYNVSFTSLTEDEENMLTPDQRRSFNSFLTKHEATFCPGESLQIMLNT
ncbi:hypothetical protein RN001_015456 [Aquatica leii]|uniref:Uncharacterized protein n=1 Tax=Aquatica leii TaxID=1421715 RepID=A0AAN7PQU3_9COLE|nr:hypothetical protein RN001_015456 [Aquatica leii]